MAKDSAFTAYDLQWKKKHRIPSPPTKITTHRLRPGEWDLHRLNSNAGIKKRKNRKQKPKTIRKPSDIITYSSPEYQCLQCDLYGDNPFCTPRCHTLFTKTHLNPITAQIEIRGPGPLGYSAFLSPSARPIPAGAWIGEYIGDLRPLSLSATQTSRYWVEIPGVCAIDPEKAGNWTRFMNSCCVPNVGLWGEFVGKRRVVLFQARRRVEPGEELCFDYGGRYWERAGVGCGCGRCGEKKGGKGRAKGDGKGGKGKRMEKSKGKGAELC